jgi:hypothetical protein
MRLASTDIQDDGMVNIASVNADAMQRRRGHHR